MFSEIVKRKLTGGLGHPALASALLLLRLLVPERTLEIVIRETLSQLDAGKWMVNGSLVDSETYVEVAQRLEVERARGVARAGEEVPDRGRINGRQLLLLLVLVLFDEQVHPDVVKLGIDGRRGRNGPGTLRGANAVHGERVLLAGLAIFRTLEDADDGDRRGRGGTGKY